MRRCLAQGLLLLLAACQAPSSPAATACTVARAAELPVRFDHGLVLVPGALNRHPVQLVIDTGAEASLVSPEAVVRFGLQQDRGRQTTITGAGGEITMTHARVNSFAIGGMETLDVSMVVGSLPSLGNGPLYGLVGGDFLANFDVEFDLPHRRMTLYHVRNCDSDFSPWDHPAAVVPLRRFHRDLLLADVQIDGQPVEAMLDSGARLSSIRTDVARRLGVDAVTLARDPLTSGSGVDNIAVAGHLHQFAEVRIGQEVVRNQRIEVAPLALPDIEMLLGVDYLQTRHVWLSYTAQRLFVAPTGR